MDVPREWMRSRHFAAEHGGEWRVVFQESWLVRPEPTIFGPKRLNLASRIDERQPELGVLSVEDAFVILPDGLIVARDRLLPDHSWYGDAHVDEISQFECDLPVRELRGTTLSIASEWSHLNYAHFLIDTLPRLDLFERAGFDLASIDQIVCPHGSPSFRRLLARLGIGPDRLIWANGKVALHCEHLIVPSFPGTRRNTPPWSVEFLRRKLLTQADRTDRRLYIPRTTTRLIWNFDELWPILERHQFEIFDPGSGEVDSIRPFAEASVVVGGHGGAMCDIAFCPPKAKVLELLPSDMPAPYLWAGADSAKLEYAYIVGESEGHRAPGWFGPSPYNYRIDPKTLSSALDELCAA